MTTTPGGGGGGSFSNQFGMPGFGGKLNLNPFSRTATIQEIRMKHYPFWFLVFTNPVLVAGAIVIIALEFWTIVAHGFQFTGTRFHDSRSFALFNFLLPLGGVGALGIAAAFTGGLVMIDWFGQVFVAGGLFLTSLLGFAFGVFTQILAWGRLGACNSGAIHDRCDTRDCTPSPCAIACAVPNDAAIAESCRGCIDFCHDERGPLIAVGVLAVVMMLFTIPNMLLAPFLLLHRPTQLMAAGVKESDRKRILTGEITFDTYLDEQHVRLRKSLLMGTNALLKANGYAPMSANGGAVVGAPLADDDGSGGTMRQRHGANGGGATTVVTLRPVHLAHAEAQRSSSGK